jgi:hypothetical protein
MAIERGGGRNYYEDQFGDRIRNIGSGGSAQPPSRPDGPGGGSKFAGGIGVFLLLVLVVGGMRSWNTSSRYSTYDPPQIQIPQVPQMPPFMLDHGDDAQRQVNEELRRLLNEQKLLDRLPPVGGDEAKPGVGPGAQNEAMRSPLLTPEDVPYLPALCYLLYKEGHHTELTPARRVFDRLDDDARKLLREIAAHANREPAPEKRDEVLEALNKVLDDPDFYDPKNFRDVDLDDLRDRLAQWTQPGKVRTLREAREINRELLEAAFPIQIVARDDQPLTDELRKQAVADAREELGVLREKYDDREP